ncbi:T9SS type B sorting domain-containing protein [Flavisericum labens]|uniref:T9SS type B sorting domain-containing protein n=1 Tax=Flavisericum labens TaxID=3377112 RepID=UPI00387ACBCD
MKYLIPILMCFTSLSLLGQGEAANWYFGYGAGIKFNLFTGTPNSVDNGLLFTNEGCTSMSDKSGNLLFYTDGSYVWNKVHKVMKSGSGLLGDRSSTQSAIIVPKPEDDNIYYVFTVGSNRSNTGLHYSVIDMSKENGLGEVIERNARLLNLCSEKITAVLKDCITKSMWVVTFASEEGNAATYNTFHAFEVSTNGVSSNSVKTSFPINITDPRGYLKLSPDGDKMACANLSADDDNNTTNHQLFLYDFDTTNGKVSNAVELKIFGNNHNPYGLEFSPNSQFLYVHSYNNYRGDDFDDDRDNPENHTSSLVQFNLNAQNIQSSMITIDERQLYRGGLQLAPNGKIYRALSATYDTGLPNLGVINEPNKVGLACNYLHDAVDLSPNQSAQGLPPFIQSIFNVQIDIIKNGKSELNLTLCNGDAYELISEDIEGATYSWTRDNIALPNSDYNLIVTKSGHYRVTVTPNNGDCIIEGQAFVFFNEKPEANSITLYQCDEDGHTDGRTLFNLTRASREITGTNTNRTLKFYSNAARTVEINGYSYQNTRNPQTIYVEVINDITGCINFSELTIGVSNTDTDDVMLPALCDDDGVEDGFRQFSLRDADQIILNGLPSGVFVSYYKSYNDALLQNNTLGAYFTNTIPYSQTIYARVKNGNNCYGISKVNLEVLRLPNINDTSTTYYCLNTAPEPIAINAGIINDNPENYTYLWSSGENNYQTEINGPGVYKVTVTNANGCSKTKTILVEPSNIAKIMDIEVKDGAKNNQITVITSGEGAYQYNLVNNNGFVVFPYQDQPTFENVPPGLYHLYVKDVKNGCGMVSEQISVIGFPKFFTPNNDGINDTWQIQGVNEMFQPNSKVLIFDRYGKLIHELDPLGAGWNGLLNNKKLPNDDYWFYVLLEDGRVFKNHFTLKR